MSKICQFPLFLPYISLKTQNTGNNYSDEILNLDSVKFKLIVAFLIRNGEKIRITCSYKLAF